MRPGTLYASVVLISATTAIATTVVIHMASSGQWRSGLFSRGDERVVVPNLVGISEKDARENLRALGVVLLLGPRKRASDADPDTVIAQSVAAGQSAQRGSAVTVTLASAGPNVPDVIGRSLPEATQLLAKEDLTLEQGEPVASSDFPLGRIVSQDPTAGISHGKARSVVVRVSSGPTEAIVPRLLGQPVSKAKETLKQAGLELGQITWIAQAETPVDIVLNQQPAPDTKSKPGEKVRITVNR
jgi:beta-lactam-binding protein with PASTA domain